MSTATPEQAPRAARPVILAVDDEPAVLAAVARDLRNHFKERARVMRATSGSEGLELLSELRRRGDDVAMLISDQRMPGMEGTEYLARTREIYPEAQRLLLTAYADSEAAIAAINDVDLDYYLQKPWDPPEVKFWPIVESYMKVWERKTDLQLTKGVRIIGHRFSAPTHDLRDFIARNRVPGRWLDIERDEEAPKLLATTEFGEDRLPVVLLENGEVLAQPTVGELAEHLGLPNRPASDHYDLVIVGGGPAGLAAAVYGASEGLNTVMVESSATGGQAGTSSRIENYLGFPTGVSGNELAERASIQARRLGAEMLTVADVTALRVEGAGRFIELENGATLSSNAVLIASGVSYRRLAAPGFEELTGAGVYYGAALTEAKACQGQGVTVIGGANSAGQAAVHFAKFAAKVTMLIRGDSLEKSMSTYLIEQIAGIPNIEVRTHTQAVAAHAEGGQLRALTLATPEGDIEFPTDACFVFIGAEPKTEWLEGVVGRDDHGFILAGADAKTDSWPLSRDPYPLETTVPGVFVAGDVRSRSIKRVASAVGEGSMAVSLIHQYLAGAS